MAKIKNNVVGCVMVEDLNIKFLPREVKEIKDEEIWRSKDLKRLLAYNLLMKVENK